MGSLHHANAKTTTAVRTEIQNSEESIAALAARLSLNPKTVMKWKHAARVEDGGSGPRQPRSKSLTPEQEAIVCQFRRLTRLGLDDVFAALKDNIPALTRSNLHRCLQRHGLSRLPPEEGEAGRARTKKKFKDYPIGYVHADITEIRLGKKKLYMFVGIDRVCKYAYVELHETMTQAVAVAFLDNLVADFPHKIHRLLTDNGVQFTYELLPPRLRPKNKTHPFDAACARHGIEHRLTKFRHPWTNGQVEVFNRTLESHTVRAYHCDTIAELKNHLFAFLLFYNHQRKLKALGYRSPYAAILKTYDENPKLFRSNPYHKTVGLNNQ